MLNRLCEHMTSATDNSTACCHGLRRPERFVLAEKQFQNCFETVSFQFHSVLRTPLVCCTWRNTKIRPMRHSLIENVPERSTAEPNHFLPRLQHFFTDRKLSYTVSSSEVTDEILPRSVARFLGDAAAAEPLVIGG